MASGGGRLGERAQQGAGRRPLEMVRRFYLLFHEERKWVVCLKLEWREGREGDTVEGGQPIAR